LTGEPGVIRDILDILPLACVVIISITHQYNHTEIQVLVSVCVRACVRPLDTHMHVLVCT